ncbi:MAG: YceI family protein [Candidatus Dadabacteria bacterium]|nr:YceI family protein [Candidatus Dadabacteria bacterium]NIS07735.1 YceI family protein [Candidatus Dadabacteria bacterium]NIV42340.1 YceI family protein [Candidatus Dadabacteria bacterium]NIY21376.1 YceI family protein [Candidatus Dadabacteria bacterium]
MKYLFILLSLFFVTLGNSAQVDLKSSEFGWYGSKITGEHFGKIMLKEATLTETDGKVTGGEFVMDMTTITVDNIDSQEYETKFLNHMKSPDFFDTANHPTARLKINKVDNNNVEGVLMIRGKSHPVAFPIEKNGDTVSGKMTFDRTKYDIIYKSKNFFENLGDKIIHDEVVLNFKVKVVEG